MKWEYRVVKRKYKNNISYGIYEVSIVGNKIRSISDLPKSPYGETTDELKKDIQDMIVAYKKDVIDFDTMKYVR